MSLNIQLESFTGPFDLLLNLIEKNKIDIYDIKIEDITNSYLEEIEKLDISINNLSEFIYIASILLNIKSNKLLPKPQEDNLEEEFLSYLIEYKKIKSVQDDFKKLEEEARKIHSKYAEDLSELNAPDIIIMRDINILSYEFEKLMKKLDKDSSPKEIIKREKNPDVNDYLINLRNMLKEKKEIKLNLLIDNIHSKEICIATFLALLELFKLQEIYLKEDENNRFVILLRS